MYKVLLLSLVLSVLLVVDIEPAAGFMGGVSAQQSRTIGGKNPLKQRNVRKANPQTRVYHNSNCRYYKSKQCTILFKSAEEARLAGFRPCSKCGG